MSPDPLPTFLDTHLRGRDPTHGLFGPDSEMWKLARWNQSLLMGARALVLQVAHPVIAQGVNDWSNFRTNPEERAQNTLGALFALIFADSETVQAMSTRIYERHLAVGGVISAATHQQRVGDPYDATKRVDKRWVHATVTDAMMRGYALVVDPRWERVDRQAVWEDFRTLGKVFRLTDSELPDKVEDFDAYMDSMVAGTTLHEGRTFEDLVHHLFNSTITRGPFDEIIGYFTLPERFQGATGRHGGLVDRLVWSAVLGVARCKVRVPIDRVRYKADYLDAMVRVGRRSKALGAPDPAPYDPDGPGVSYH